MIVSRLIMKEHNMKRSLFIIFCFAAIFTIKCPVALAAISETKIKGLEKILKPEYSRLSPIYGLAFLRSRVLDHIRFDGNYGPLNEKYKCHAQLKPEQQAKDCPQDDVTVFVQQFFPSPAGGQLHDNTTPDLIGKLNLKAIGGILKVLEKRQEFGDNLYKLLAIEIYKNQDPNGYQDFLSKIIRSQQGKLSHEQTVEIGKIRKRMKDQNAKLTSIDIDETERENIKSEIIKLKERLKRIGKEERPELDEGRYVDNLYDVLKKEGTTGNKQENFFTPYINLTTIIIQAIEGLKNYPNDYPPNIIEQTLLTFVWKKAENKNDFLSFFEGLGLDKIKPEFVQEDPTTHMKSILPPPDWETPFVKEDYETFKKGFIGKLPPIAVLEQLLADPETAVFDTLAFELYESPYPPMLPMGWVEMPIEGKKVRFQDCGEVAVRDFLNVMFFDNNTRSFDPELVKAIAPNAKPELIRFYAEQTTDNMEEKRQEWGELVSHLPVRTRPRL